MTDESALIGGSGAMQTNSLADLWPLLQDLVSLRSAFDEHLPIRNSLIALDILVEVLLSHHQNRPLQIKVLLQGLPHSRTGIDYHYRWLIDQGWIEIVPCLKDKRVRYVKPTGLLMNQLLIIMNTLDGKLNSFIPDGQQCASCPPAATQNPPSVATPKSPSS